MTFRVSTFVGWSAFLLLGGCADHVGFYEQEEVTLASVGISPTQNVAEQIDASMLFQGGRSMYAVVPKNNRTEEAKSVVANFIVGGRKAGRQFELRSGFASGTAASTIAANPVAMQSLLGIKPVGILSAGDLSKRHDLLNCVEKLSDSKVIEIYKTLSKHEFSAAAAREELEGLLANYDDDTIEVLHNQCSAGG